jgi:hypothetical protein
LEDIKQIDEEELSWDNTPPALRERVQTKFKIENWKSAGIDAF